ncbi:MAG TPA: hypothetical protein VH143_03965 [Kofleriaceae bacterium]|jgi:hypothetical protein|nr:hypothetical protein [Kofleriaceae bacterium]
MPIRRDLWRVVVFVLFAAALFLPAIRIDRHHSAVGLVCIELGWWTVPWYANLLLVLGLISLGIGWNGVALTLGVFAVFVALTTFIYVRVDELQAGFYVWLASLVAFTIACARRCVRT